MIKTRETTMSQAKVDEPAPCKSDPANMSSKRSALGLFVSYENNLGHVNSERDRGFRPEQTFATVMGYAKVSHYIFDTCSDPDCQESSGRLGPQMSLL
jgi:hypothetical protein